MIVGKSGGNLIQYLRATSYSVNSAILLAKASDMWTVLEVSIVTVEC
jgi:hypothetical protein